MKLKILVAIAAMASALPAASEPLQPSARAFIDWSTFTVTLEPVGADNTTRTIEWLSKTTEVNANSNQVLSLNWTTAITAPDGVASATAYGSTGVSADGSPLDGSPLLAEFSGVPADLNSSASVFRRGSFRLTARSIAVFSVQATTYILMDKPVNGGAYAQASLQVDGPGAYGEFAQQSRVPILSSASGLEDSDSTTLQAIFTNLTNGTLDGTLTAFARVDKNGLIPAIPEPRTYAMMLAGLGLLGFVSRRRKLVVVPA